MQTFLPHSSFTKSARVLDYRRLGKQRVECKQLLTALLGETTGWREHAAARMWEGYEVALCRYALAVCLEWRRRGYKDTLYEYFLGRYPELVKRLGDPVAPPWLGSKVFHASHRSNLLRKDLEFYGRYGWKESSDLPYHWPAGLKGR